MRRIPPYKKTVIAPPMPAIRLPDRAARPRRARDLTEGLQLYPLRKKITFYGYEIPHRAEWTSSVHSAVIIHGGGVRNHRLGGLEYLCHPGFPAGAGFGPKQIQPTHRPTHQEPTDQSQRHPFFNTTQDIVPQHDLPVCQELRRGRVGYVHLRTAGFANIGKLNRHEQVISKHRRTPTEHGCQTCFPA